MSEHSKDGNEAWDLGMDLAVWARTCFSAEDWAKVREYYRIEAHGGEPMAPYSAAQHFAFYMEGLDVDDETIEPSTLHDVAEKFWDGFLDQVRPEERYRAEELIHHEAFIVSFVQTLCDPGNAAA